MEQPGKPANLLHTEASLEKNIVADIEISNSSAKSLRNRGRAVQRVGQRGRVPLSEEGRVDVGSVNIGVAADAWRQLRRSCVHPVNRAGRARAMALVAHCVLLLH